MRSREACSGSNRVDWKALAAQQLVKGDNQSSRDEDSRESASRESEWRSALEHQRTCMSCRTAAIAAEPTVVFQSLPSIELSDAEIDVMRERVAGVRRGRVVAGGQESIPGSHASGPPASGPPAFGFPAGRSQLQKWASVAAVLAIAVTGSLGVGLAPGVAAGLTAADEAALEASLGALPLVEGVESYGTEQSVLVQGLMRSASGDLDFAWVADGELEL